MSLLWLYCFNLLAVIDPSGFSITFNKAQQQIVSSIGMYWYLFWQFVWKKEGTSSIAILVCFLLYVILSFWWKLIYCLNVEGTSSIAYLVWNLLNAILSFVWKLILWFFVSNVNGRLARPSITFFLYCSFSNANLAVTLR